MQIHERNQQTDLDSEYAVVQLRDKHFQIRRIQLQMFQAIVNFWIIVITGVVASELVFLLGGGRLGVELAALCTGFLLYGFERWKKFAQSLQILTLASNIYFALFVVIDIGFVGLSFRFITVGYILFISCCAVRYRWKSQAIIFAFFYAFELFIISSWYDNTNTFNTPSVMVGLMLSVGLGITSAISIIAALTIFYCIEPEYCTRWNIIGMLYLFGLLIVISGLFYIPVGFYLMDYQLFTLFQYSAITNMVMLAYSLGFRLDIIVFLCDVTDTVQQQLEERWSQINQASIQKTKFRLVSSNYCTEIPLADEIVNELQESVKVGECLVCFEEKAQIIARPCGHTAICLKCGVQLLMVADTKCILCKESMRQIYILQQQETQKSQSELQAETSSGLLKIQKGYKRNEVSCHY